MMRDEPTQGYQLMRRTAEYHGIELSIFGEGLKWENYVQSKVVRFFDWARKLRGYDYIVFVDADDTLFATGLGELHAKFEQYGSDFVMAGEHYCWPFGKQFDKRTPNQSQRFRNACSGFYMATWPAFLDRIEKLIQMPAPADPQFARVAHCDQGRFQYAWMNGYLDLAVDYRCLLSQSMNGLDGRWLPTNQDILWGRRPQNRITSSYPCTFHCNGGCQKWRLPEIAEMLLA